MTIFSSPALPAKCSQFSQTGCLYWHPSNSVNTQKATWYNRHNDITNTRCYSVVLYAVLQDCNMMICNKHEKHQIQTSVISAELGPNRIW